jgi:hypothetical protein
MVRSTQVRVIKRDERERSAREAAAGAVTEKSPREAARELVASVTRWVEEFREKPAEELTAL